MKIALGQTVGTPYDKAANLRLMKNLASEAVGQGADVLVLPELFLTGYNIGDAAAALAEPIDGSSARIAGQIAAAAGLAIVYGYPERTGEGIYNAAAVVDRTGRLIANYRKTHLWGEYEADQFLPGQRPEIVELDGHRFGLQICYDLDFPEMARALSLSGVEGLLALSATTAPYPVVPRHLVPARAYENQLFVVFANRAGEERGLRYAGESCIAAPDGAILLKCGQEEALAYANMDPARYAAYRQTHSYASNRRPDFYGLLFS